jgi:Uma2 family endonuclease
MSTVGRQTVGHQTVGHQQVKPVTAEELLHMPGDGFRYELVRGELKKMAPAGGDHGFIAHDIPGPPDLAVEVISPSDRYSELQEKVMAWLEAGTRMVLVSTRAGAP